MREQIYGYLTAGTFRRSDFTFEELSCLIEQRAHGLLLLDPVIGEKHVELKDWCQRNEIDLVLGYTDYPDNPDQGRLTQAMAITKKIAIGNTHMHEWRDRGGTGHNNVDDYLRMADKYGFEWVCTITQNSILRDLRRGVKRRQLGQTFCMCLCGYAIAGHLYNVPKIPHQYVVNRRALQGVTAKMIQDYLQPMNVFSGGGFQEGLLAGSRMHVRQLGFKGLVIGVPFDLQVGNPLSDERS